jgi:DMSO/TMAO reductase YedYZ molybdopterin-dependent catalytic subunit
MNERREAPGGPWWQGPVLGLVTLAVALGVAQAVAGWVGVAASPIVAVGQAAIDATPEWLKSFAIRTFGSRDKQVLLIGIVVALVIAGTLIGIVAIRRPRVAWIGLGVLTGVGVWAVLTRPAAELADILPVVVGAGAGALTLRALLRALRPGARPTEGASDPDRRRFLVTAGVGAAAAVVAGSAGTFLSRRFRVDESRAMVMIPRPASPAPRAKETFDDVRGISTYLTPNDTFYRVDTALLTPAVTADEWKLRIHGMVDHERTLTYADLLARPLIERDITLACVSNPVGGHYVGTARWIGAPLADILREAGVQHGADQLVATSVDGFTVGTPTAALMDGRDAMLAIAMNGEPLPVAHGFPVRVVVPGLYGYVSATKWVVDMELTTFGAYDAYWVKRGWSQQAPIKVESRIDVPGKGSIDAGPRDIAGVAWAQHVGIASVEVQIDGGDWRRAELAPQAPIDTWRQWQLPWNATSGQHTLAVRATNLDGETQTDTRAQPFPDGATGYHTIVVQVR